MEDSRKWVLSFCGLLAIGVVILGIVYYWPFGASQDISKHLIESMYNVNGANLTDKNREALSLIDESIKYKIDVNNIKNLRDRYLEFQGEPTSVEYILSAHKGGKDYNYIKVSSANISKNIFIITTVKEDKIVEYEEYFLQPIVQY